MSRKNPSASEDDLIHDIMDTVFVSFGEEILKIVPGRVSTEIDARFPLIEKLKLRKLDILLNCMKNEEYLKIEF